MDRKWWVALFVVPFVLALDVITKRWALAALEPGRTVDGLVDWVPFTLAFNTGAAFSLSVGGASRWFFLVISLVALVVLFSLYRQTTTEQPGRLAALALIASGAMGNLIDRVRWDRGVVDFLGPVDLGFMHWPIFNVADIAITTGAALLVVSFWREDHAAEADATASRALATEGGTEVR